MATYAFKVKKGKYQLDLSTTDKDLLVSQFELWVKQAGAYAKGGEIFVLDMGEPVKIYDLAVSLIKLTGLEPEIDIPIKITGLRPGEKLYEELLMSEEGLTNTEHNKIFIGKPSNITNEEVENNRFTSANMLYRYKERLRLSTA